jgi:Relaxase/Mobilisation nuclease domain.
MATTHIKRSTSASRLVNYAEKRAVKKDGLNLDIQYAKSEFKQVGPSMAILVKPKRMPAGLPLARWNLIRKILMIRQLF